MVKSAVVMMFMHIWRISVCNIDVRDDSDVIQNAFETNKQKLRGLSLQPNYTDRATPLVGEVSANFCG
jgi:hypothetical protein